MIIKKLTIKLEIKIVEDAIEKNKDYVRQLKIMNGVSKAVEKMIMTL